jgi:hypothetical protein
VLISTDVFTRVCQSASRLGGMPEIRWANVPHPIGSLTEEELRAVAESATEQFIDIITNRR